MSETVVGDLGDEVRDLGTGNDETEEAALVGRRHSGRVDDTTARASTEKHEEGVVASALSLGSASSSGALSLASNGDIMKGHRTRGNDGNCRAENLLHHRSHGFRGAAPALASDKEVPGGESWGWGVSTSGTILGGADYPSARTDVG